MQIATDEQIRLVDSRGTDRENWENALIARIKEYQHPNAVFLSADDVDEAQHDDPDCCPLCGA